MARASALHAEGQRFESVILHQGEHNDMMEASALLHADRISVEGWRGARKTREKSRANERFEQVLETGKAT